MRDCHAGANRACFVARVLESCNFLVPLVVEACMRGGGGEKEESRGGGGGKSGNQVFHAAINKSFGPVACNATLHSTQRIFNHLLDASISND